MNLTKKTIKCNTITDRQENATFNESTSDQKFTVKYSVSNSAANENLVIVMTLERCSKERVEKEKGNNVDTVEDKIQNANLTALDRIFTPEND